MRVLARVVADSDLVFTTSGEDRPAGVHVSDILKFMMFERDRKLNPNTPLDMAAIDRGFTWEEVLSHALQRRRRKDDTGYRPDPFQDDEWGIWHSPDWVQPDADVQHEEWKSTKASRKTPFEEKQWYWLPQAMCYVRALLRRKAIDRPVTRFWVWYVNGDYSYDAKASDLHLLRDYVRIDVEFSVRELEENWRRVISAGQKYGLLPGIHGIDTDRGNRWAKPTRTERRKPKASKARPRSRGIDLTAMRRRTSRS